MFPAAFITFRLFGFSDVTHINYPVLTQDSEIKFCEHATKPGNVNSESAIKKVFRIRHESLKISYIVLVIDNYWITDVFVMSSKTEVDVISLG